MKDHSCFHSQRRTLHSPRNLTGQRLGNHKRPPDNDAPAASIEISFFFTTSATIRVLLMGSGAGRIRQIARWLPQGHQVGTSQIAESFPGHEITMKGFPVSSFSHSSFELLVKAILHPSVENAGQLPLSARVLLLPSEDTSHIREAGHLHIAVVDLGVTTSSIWTEVLSRALSTPVSRLTETTRVPSEAMSVLSFQLMSAEIASSPNSASFCVRKASMSIRIRDASW